MSDLPWFRFYSRFITDPDVEELSFEDQRHYVFVLCLKCNGLLDKHFPTKEKRERAIARRLGLQGEAFMFAKDRLQESGLIDENWQPRSWDQLQMKSDSAAERMRKYRAKKKGLDDVTGPLRNSDAIEKNRVDTDKNRTEKELPPSLNREAWQSYLAHRRELKAKRLTERGMQMAMAKLAELPAGEQLQIVELSIANGWTGLFPEKRQSAPTRKLSYPEQLHADMKAKGMLDDVEN